MPANSLTTSPRLATSRQTRAKAATRRENSSRINAARPLPVNAPRRAAISCTSSRPTATKSMKNSIR
jgi:hypothetical protein